MPRPVLRRRFSVFLVRAAARLGATVVLAAAAASADAGQSARLDDVLQNARVYLAEYEQRFSSVLSEEQYVQEIRGGVVPLAQDPSAAARGRPPTGGAVAVAGTVARRQLVSTYLIVHFPDGWLPFRDVFEVNGRAVRGRDDRLARLFTHQTGTSLEQAQQIMAESARHNLGDVDRTVNIPVFALLFLSARHSERFEFQLIGQETVDGRRTVVLRYRESARPTLVTSRDGADVPSRGRLWVEPETGRVLKTEHIVTSDDVRGTVTVTYRDDPALQMWLPARMEETYRRSGPLRATVRGTATYSKYQRLVVATAQRVEPRSAQSAEHAPAAASGKTRAESALAIARVLAARYPATVTMSYIPALSWSGALRLSALTGEPQWREKARRQMQPFLSGEKPPITEPYLLTSLAGHLAFADLASLDNDAAAAALARTAADFMLPESPDEIVRFPRAWTDDMFMATSLLARAERLFSASRASSTGLSTSGPAQPPGDRYAAAVGRLLTSYAEKLQRPDGLFIHAVEGPYTWGRGNGFAALALTDALSYLPESWPARGAVLEIYRRHMRALVPHQSDDGAWRQVVDEPSSYHELTVTAMTLAAMARGVRLGWLDDSFRPVIDRAWEAVQARVGHDGAVRNVCVGTGAGSTKEYYLNRTALDGFDDRGGAMALVAALEIAELPGLAR